MFILWNVKDKWDIECLAKFQHHSCLSDYYWPQTDGGANCRSQPNVTKHCFLTSCDREHETVQYTFPCHWSTCIIIYEHFPWGLQGSNPRVTTAILKVTHYSHLESPNRWIRLISQGTLAGYNSQQFLIISTNLHTSVNYPIW